MAADTHPDIRRRQIEILRQMSPGRRAQLASSLTNDVYWRAVRAIERTYPHLGKEERKLKFIQVHYGAELAERVRQSLLRQVNASLD